MNHFSVFLSYEETLTSQVHTPTAVEPDWKKTIKRKAKVFYTLKEMFSVYFSSSFKNSSCQHLSSLEVLSHLKLVNRRCWLDWTTHLWYNHMTSSIARSILKWILSTVFRSWIRLLKWLNLPCLTLNLMHAFRVFLGILYLAGEKKNHNFILTG